MLYSRMTLVKTNKKQKMTVKWIKIISCAHQRSGMKEKTRDYKLLT